MAIPSARRAKLSGYVQPDQLLPWRWAEHRLTMARNYWVTTHASGYPSSRPVWGLWRGVDADQRGPVEGASRRTTPRFWFSTGSAIGRHLERDARVQVSLESADEVVMVEGIAGPLAEADAAEWAEVYNLKYLWDFAPDVDGVWDIRPVRVLAWTSDSTGLDRGAGFANSATEWVFAEP